MICNEFDKITTYDEDLNKILCLAEWNDDEEAGTLKIHQDGASTTIAEGVHDFCLAPDGRVFYLNDYSLNYEKGTLYEWINGESKKIDDDVYDIIPYSEIEYKWSYYFRIQ